MIEDVSYDDQSLVDGLPEWATMTQVSTALHIPRSAVRSVVRRAAANNEEWVKKECDGGNIHYQINTHHETYLSHRARWMQKKELEASSLCDPGAATRSHATQPSFSGQGREEHSFSLLNYGCLGYEIFSWSRFQQWLCLQGIEVFKNVLAGDDVLNAWQWRWGELSGDGYLEVEDAIIAALESRLKVNAREQQPQENTSHALEQDVSQEPQRRWSLFRRT